MKAISDARSYFFDKKYDSDTSKMIAWNSMQLEGLGIHVETKECKKEPQQLISQHMVIPMLLNVVARYVFNQNIFDIYEAGTVFSAMSDEQLVEEITAIIKLFYKQSSSNFCAISHNQHALNLSLVSAAGKPTISFDEKSNVTNTTIYNRFFDGDKLCIPAYIICYCFKDKTLDKQRRDIAASLFAHTRSWKRGAADPVSDSSLIKPLIDFGSVLDSSIVSEPSSSLETEIANLTKMIVGMRADIDEMKSMLRQLTAPRPQATMESIFSGL